MNAPSRLRAEYLGDAVLGLGAHRPRISWQLPAGASGQRRYRVETGATVGPWVETAASVLVPWPGDPVASGTRVEWRVQVETDLGLSDWSASAWFETGLLDEADWTAAWIEHPDDPPRPAPDQGHPAHLFRSRFVLDAAPRVARLHATAHGIYETFLNGRRVGDQELTPGFTSYWDHLDVQTFDVTDLLRTGDNEWTAIVSDGWYRGRTGNGQEANGYGDRLAFLGQLHADGVVVGTGPGWEAATGPVLAADLMAGQVVDQRVSEGPWQPAAGVDHGFDRLGASPAPPSRRVEELAPVSVVDLGNGRQIVDLGQNINGWIRLEDCGPEATDLSLVHGEVLDDAGDVTLEHLCFGENRLRQADRVISAGRGEPFEPRHTTHGFRYVRVDGHPGALRPADINGVVVHTDLRRTGTFRCSDDRINRLHEIADWSFRGNACEIPTDCPQRERSGWTGDWQVFVQSAAFLYDVAGFSRKWLRSLVADQLPDGCIPNLAPEPRRARRDPEDLGWTGMFGSSGWGDAVVLVPWRLRGIYGDDSVLADLWTAMERWMAYAVAAARDRRHPKRAAARPEPAPHEEFLWDGGWHWGEWCEPGEPEEPFYVADQGHVGTAYLHHSAATMAQIAAVLDRTDDVRKYQDLAFRVRDAWQIEFLDDDGTVRPDTQASLVRALAFDLIPEDARTAVAGRLAELVREAGTRLSTGFLATADLLPVLADNGHPDVAFDLLFQDETPSWLAMVDAGATTVWENWEGLVDAGDGIPRGSLNHYSKGAVISFLHTHVAGIRRLDEHPGYRRFIVEPLVDPRLRSAEGVHECPYGTIRSAWRTGGGTFALDVEVPAGTTALVRLPDGVEREAAPGRHHYSCVIAR